MRRSNIGSCILYYFRNVRLLCRYIIIFLSFCFPNLCPKCLSSGPWNRVHITILPKTRLALQARPTALPKKGSASFSAWINGPSQLSTPLAFAWTYELTASPAVYGIFSFSSTASRESVSIHRNKSARCPHNLPQRRGWGWGGGWGRGGGGMVVDRSHWRSSHTWMRIVRTTHTHIVCGISSHSL